MDISPTVDISDPEAAEILLFDDGIGVKKQKETHSRNQDVVVTEPNLSGQKNKRSSVITDVVLLQTPRGSFEYVTSSIDNQGQPLIPLEQIVKSKLNYYYQTYCYY